MGKYLDILDAQRREREADERRQQDERPNDINDNNDIDDKRADAELGRINRLGRIGRLSRSPGLPHPVYGHDRFSLIRFTHPAISKARH